MLLTKNIIHGDGIDISRVIVRGNLGDVVTVLVNGTPHNIICDTQSIVDYSGILEISCDTPNLTIVITAGSETAIIYSVGAP